MSNVYADHTPKPSGGGDYLKIEDGETALVHIASEPAIFDVENKPDEKGNVRISTRYAWIVWVKEIRFKDNKKPINAAQIFQGSATFFKQLKGLAMDDDFGDPKGYDIKISREGKMLETTYTIMPSPNKSELGFKEMDAVSNINLIEAISASPFSQHVMWLSEFDKPHAAAAPSAPAAKPADDWATDASETLDSGPLNLDDIPY